MVEKPKCLNDVFITWLSGGGIFSVLQDFPVPWKSENISQSLDLEYHGNISGDKIISPLIENIMTGNVLSISDKKMIAMAIVAINNANWTRQWETLSFNYNPIENYSMTEKMTNDETVYSYGKNHTRTDNLSHKYNGTETNTPDLTTDTSTELYGFNSGSAVPFDSGKTVATGTNTVVSDNTLNDTGTQQESDSGEDTHTRNYELTRSGNIGVTTSQQMIESERQLRLWNFFREIVFPDLDRVLTIQIY